jgi:hypothetical protein
MRMNIGIMRPLIVGCAMGLFFLAAPASRADDSDVDIATPDGEAIMNSDYDPGVLESVVEEDKAKCPDKETSCVTEKKTVKNKVETVIYALVELDPKTCKEIDTGTWSELKKPAHGKIEQGTIKGKASSGPCKGKTYTFEAIAYTGDAKKLPEKDSFEAVWTTSDGKLKVGLTADITIAK